MKVSLQWAQKYDPDLKPKSIDELVKLATERLGGVEGYEELGTRYEGVVVAKVVSCVKHANADKLNVCKIDDGGAVKHVKRDDDGLVQVVCGAPNVREGLLVAWIPPKATVPASYDEEHPFVLDARELRGEVSNGMLASPKELAISDDHEGILEITENVNPGTDFKQVYNLDDVILEIENKMFTHRPDCFGQLGVARELAGIQHKPFASPDWYLNPPAIASEPSTEVQGLTVAIEAEDLCPRYMAVVLESADIKPSPVWLQSYLKRLGVRPINNVVDVTNYIMLETAQPLHAFDFDKVATNGSAEIVVRRPKSGEKMTLLDGKEIEPHADAVLICNSNEPIALGGVMGGGNSEIDANTKRIVLECATFDMYNIRRTSMTHGIFTDAVTRFTKGQPLAQLPAVLAQAVRMLKEVSGAHVVGAPVDVASKQAKPTEEDAYIEISAKFINDRLGSKLTEDEIVRLLNNVEFKAHKASGLISVTAPFWRTDIEIPEDIVEEVGRMYGFNQLPLSLPQRDITPVLTNQSLALKQSIRTKLSRAGANEVLSYSFVHGNLLKKVGQNAEHAYKLRNALSPDLQYYRLAIAPSLLDKVHSNIKDGYDQFALFELGRVHYKGEMDQNEPNVPNEDDHLGFTIAYADKVKTEGSPYYHARLYLEQIAPELASELVPLNAFDLKKDEWGQQLVSAYEPSRTALIVRDGQIWGVVGEYKTSVKQAFKLPEYSAGFEVHLDVLSLPKQAYTPLSKYPSTDQDLTLKVTDDLPYASVESLIQNHLEATSYSALLQPLSVFQQEGSDTKNISFRITLSHNERTLTTEDVNALLEQISAELKQEFEAERV